MVAQTKKYTQGHLLAAVCFDVSTAVWVLLHVCLPSRPVTGKLCQRLTTVRTATSPAGDQNLQAPDT